MFKHLRDHRNMLRAAFAHPETPKRKGTLRSCLRYHRLIHVRDDGSSLRYDRRPVVGNRPVAGRNRDGKPYSALVPSLNRIAIMKFL
jgi:hypothetical protein